MKRHPFRKMRETLLRVQMLVALLLATEGIAAWEQNDYALMFIMNQMIKGFDNPTNTQYAGALGAYLRFMRRLVDKLPEGELKTTSDAEWVKISAGYEDLLEVQPSKQ